MWKRLVHTDSDYAATILRTVLGVVFFAHGAQKVLGWFGGRGFDATLSVFTDGMHVPAAFALMAIATEFFGSMALVTGLLTRVAALAVAIEMFVAVELRHAPNGFFMNWGGNQGGEGFEFHLLAIGMATTLMILGGGAWSLDRLLTNEHRHSTTEAAHAR